jgi:hypothetical protein
VHGRLPNGHRARATQPCDRRRVGLSTLSRAGPRHPEGRFETSEIETVFGRERHAGQPTSGLPMGQLDVDLSCVRKCLLTRDFPEAAKLVVGRTLEGELARFDSAQLAKPDALGKRDSVVLVSHAHAQR